jgi:hypothetical protein
MPARSPHPAQLFRLCRDRLPPLITGLEVAGAARACESDESLSLQMEPEPAPAQAGQPLEVIVTAVGTSLQARFVQQPSAGLCLACFGRRAERPFRSSPGRPNAPVPPGNRE